MFKSTKGSHKFLNVSAALPLSDLIIVGVENITTVSGNVTLRVFSFRSLYKISLDVELEASFVTM